MSNWQFPKQKKEYYFIGCRQISRIAVKEGIKGNYSKESSLHLNLIISGDNYGFIITTNAFFAEGHLLYPYKGQNFQS